MRLLPEYKIKFIGDDKEYSVRPGYGDSAKAMNKFPPDERRSINQYGMDIAVDDNEILRLLYSLYLACRRLDISDRPFETPFSEEGEKKPDFLDSLDGHERVLTEEEKKRLEEAKEQFERIVNKDGNDPLDSVPSETS